MRQRPPLMPLIAALPSTVPFVGPEAQERERGRAFRARIGANESSFGPSPRVITHMAGIARDPVWSSSGDLIVFTGANVSVDARATRMKAGMPSTPRMQVRLKIDWPR